jgi:5-methylcytosine-specific restriction endonuclease McrA
MAKIKMMRAGIGAVLDPRIVRPAPKTGDAFYDTKEWRRMRDRVRREAGGMCQWPGCTAHGRYVDHRVERGYDGGADLDRENLWLLCASHHAKKTAAARAARRFR